MDAGRHLHSFAAGVVVIGLLALAPASLAAGEESPPPTVLVKVSDSGFHWSDAAIGAGAAIAAGFLVLGLVLTFRSTRRRAT